MTDSTSEELLYLVSSVFHKVSAATDIVHAGLGLTAGMRSILTGLSVHGPRTVSKMAEDRPVSRQYMQRLCDDLIEMGLVAGKPNPRHKRSPLLALTPKGRRTVAEIRASEAPHIRELVAGLSKADVLTAIRVLAGLGEQLSPDALRALQRRIAPSAPSLRAKTQ